VAAGCVSVEIEMPTCTWPVDKTFMSTTTRPPQQAASPPDAAAAPLALAAPAALCAPFFVFCAAKSAADDFAADGADEHDVGADGVAGDVTPPPTPAPPLPMPFFCCPLSFSFSSSFFVTATSLPLPLMAPRAMRTSQHSLRLLACRILHLCV
jgi:hypothetical protein